MFLNICVTIAVVILIIYIYFRRRPSIKEGLGSSVAPPEISGNTVLYNGNAYRVLPRNGVPVSPTNMGGSSVLTPSTRFPLYTPISIPSGWTVAPSNADSIKIIESYGWGTGMLFTGFINSPLGPNIVITKGKSSDDSHGIPGPLAPTVSRSNPNWGDAWWWPAVVGTTLTLHNGSGFAGGGYINVLLIKTSSGPTPPSSGVGCKSGEILPGGNSCSVQCISGETITKQGSFDYSCSPTGLVAPTAQCGSVVKCPSPDAKLSPCLVPAFTNGTRGGSSGPCKPGTYLQSGDFCTIQCVAGYNSNSGTSQYHCANGTMDKKPGLQCTPPEGCTITSLGPGVMAASKNGCIVPETLKKSPPCTINLPNGYTGCGTTLAAGASCKASCGSYYTPNKGSMTYTCPPTGTVDISGVGDLICTPPCPVPLTNVTGDTNCSSGSLVAGASCNTSCTPPYTGTGGSYTCSKDGTLTTSEPAACNAPSCPVTATNATGCGPTLEAGGSCTAICDTGYVGGGTYTCSADGTLSPGGACTAMPACVNPATIYTGMNDQVYPWGSSAPGSNGWSYMPSNSGPR